MSSEGRGRVAFEDLLRRGTRLLRQGKAEQARRLLEKAHAMEPEHINASLNLSGAYILSGRFSKAVPLLEATLQRDPHNAMIWINLGAAYLSNPILATDEQQTKAIEAFKRALILNPAASGVAYNLGLIYRDRGERVEAIHWFRQALKANPRDRDARRNLERLREDAEGSETVSGS